MTLWGGRFVEQTDEALKALNDSIRFDKRMYSQDIAGSIAYVKAIANAGVITDNESEIIVKGLLSVKKEFDAASFEFRVTDEDIHTAVERRLIELVGPVGGKLHTGRSRNDQVATDFRLWVMEAIDAIDAATHDLQQAIVDQAQEHVDTLMPGYTHLQPAQPITFAHWVLSFFWMLARDRDRLGDARRRTAILPLGAGALAGTPFGIDRAALATDLSMNSYSHNSIDAVSDRDFVAETLFTIALLGTHLSRLAEDIIIYSNPLFRFITIHDQYSTGSSLMPQKRNADPMELARGKTGRFIGLLTGFLTTLKGLPSAYNKDLQEDKEATFNSTDEILTILPVITSIIKTLTIHPESMYAALTDEMLATDLADYLVRKGMPFREAHHIIRQIVRDTTAKKTKLSSLRPNELTAYSTLFTTNVNTVFNFTTSIKQRKTTGGTAPEAVRQQIKSAKQYLTEFAH